MEEVEQLQEGNLTWTLHGSGRLDMSPSIIMRDSKLQIESTVSKAAFSKAPRRTASEEGQGTEGTRRVSRMWILIEA